MALVPAPSLGLLGLVALRRALAAAPALPRRRVARAHGRAGRLHERVLGDGRVELDLVDRELEDLVAVERRLRVEGEEDPVDLLEVAPIGHHLALRDGLGLADEAG